MIRRLFFSLKMLSNCSKNIVALFLMMMMMMMMMMIMMMMMMTMMIMMMMMMMLTFPCSSGLHSSLTLKSVLGTVEIVLF